jgi:PAS domain S-box-containing protein
LTALKLARPAVEPEPAAIPEELSGSMTEPDLTDLDIAQWRAELLDPTAWGGILSQFGRSMNLAVALTDLRGNLLGSCHNPQPVWALAHHSPLGQSWRPGCPMCLIPQPSCSAVSEALATREIASLREPSGMVHAAIPLFLGNQPLGALVAGQTFDRYPQPLALQRVARHFGVSQQKLWYAAVHQVPLSPATLRVYADLLASLGHAFLRQRYGAILDRKLHQTNERYRLMIEGSNDHALITVDRAGRITSWNPGAQRLVGYTEAEILGKDYSIFFSPDDVKNGLPQRQIRLVEELGWIEQETWHIRKDGTRFLSETVMARLGENDAREYGKLLHDVTEERKKAAESLRSQKLESLGVLTAGIAHDFNNLLTGILGNISLAMADLQPNHPARHLLDVAERAGLKAGVLISQLLAYGGKGELVVSQFDLSALVSEIIPLIAASIPPAVPLDLSLPAGLPWITADTSEIQQIIMNLVINGAESFGPEGGALHVSTGVEDSGGVYLEVRDSGCGMDEATQRRIFEPFFTTKRTGRGLGLAAVSGIVQRLKGRLELRSAPGAGSTFRMVLPGTPPRIPEVPDAKVTAVSEPAAAKVILVVDDEAMVRDFLSNSLKRYGYSVLTAENGLEGVDVFRQNADTISAVLLDLTMPVMSGGEAFRLMNGIRPEIPVVISSGYSDTGLSEEFSGALAGVIRKPYTVSELSEKLAAVLTG